MMFEFSADHAAVRDRARVFAATLRARAAQIDQSASVPDEVVSAVRAIGSGDLLATVIAVEEIAAASAAAAVTLAGDGGQPMGLVGLRGAPALEDTPRAQLVLAAVALGVGRAALEAALAAVKAAGEGAGGDTEKPHWVVADVATELDAARLLTYKAARSTAETDIALARLLASGAAQRTVDAALRVVGPPALEPGSTLERLVRDVRAVALVRGTEEDQRATAAQTLLPR